jgi:hypothetical protein
MCSRPKCVQWPIIATSAASQRARRKKGPLPSSSACGSRGMFSSLSLSLVVHRHRHTCTYMHTHTYINTYIHTHIHTYIHIYRHVWYTLMLGHAVLRVRREGTVRTYALVSDLGKQDVRVLVPAYGLETLLLLPPTLTAAVATEAGTHKVMVLRHRRGSRGAQRPGARERAAANEAAPAGDVLRLRLGTRVEVDLSAIVNVSPQVHIYIHTQSMGIMAGGAGAHVLGGGGGGRMLCRSCCAPWSCRRPWPSLCE